MWLFGGLVEEGLGVIYGLILALATLLVFDRRAAVFWFGVFVVQVAFGIVVADNVEPRYVDEQLSLNTGLNVIAFGIVTMAIVLYFVRTRSSCSVPPDAKARSRCGVRVHIAPAPHRPCITRPRQPSTTTPRANLTYTSSAIWSVLFPSEPPPRH